MNANTQLDLGRLFLRVTLGALVLLHGVAKLNGGLAPLVSMVEHHGLPGFLGYCVILGEVIAPLMLLAGFYARVGGVLVVINMLFAIYLVHMGQLASLNGQGGWALELQAMFLVSGLAIALMGPGSYSANGK